MSLICLYTVKNIRNNSEKDFFIQQIKTLAKHNNRGIKFFVGWSEPLISHIQKDSLIINIFDSPESDNCELFLLPDGWYINGHTNKSAFSERMKFLQEISNIFIDKKYAIELYLGQSGTHPDDFFDVTLQNHELIDYLTKTVGAGGVDNGVHINIILSRDCCR